MKGEKDHTQQKLEKLHAVLEKERAALRDVLSAARKAVDDLKVRLPTSPHFCAMQVLACRGIVIVESEAIVGERKGRGSGIGTRLNALQRRQ